MPTRIRIVALGDSTTAGTPGFLSPIEVPPDGAGDVRSQFTYWLEQAQPDWQVLNCGVNGERSDEITARVDRDVLALEPRAVVVIGGVNDVYQGHPADQVMTRLDALYRRLTRAGLPLVAGTILPYDTATSSHNAAMQRINAWIETRAADDPLVWWCDTRAAVASRDDPHRLVSSPDGLHPSVDGYRRMALALAPVIETVLRAQAAP